MGDRANIRIKEEKGGIIYFYTHWGGDALPIILKNALIRGKERWDDESYLSRIIFSEMIKDDVLNETGFGISTYETDNEHPIIEVDMKNETVIIEGKLCTFSEYIDDNQGKFDEFNRLYNGEENEHF